MLVYECAYLRKLFLRSTYILRFNTFEMSNSLQSKSLLPQTITKILFAYDKSEYHQFAITLFSNIFDNFLIKNKSSSYKLTDLEFINIINKAFSKIEPYISFSKQSIPAYYSQEDKVLIEAIYKEFAIVEKELSNNLSSEANTSLKLNILLQYFLDICEYKNLFDKEHKPNKLNVAVILLENMYRNKEFQKHLNSTSNPYQLTLTNSLPKQIQAAYKFVFDIDFKENSSTGYFQELIVSIDNSYQNTSSEQNISNIISVINIFSKYITSINPNFKTIILKLNNKNYTSVSRNISLQITTSKWVITGDDDDINFSFEYITNLIKPLDLTTLKRITFRNIHNSNVNFDEETRNVIKQSYYMIFDGKITVPQWANLFDVEFLRKYHIYTLPSLQTAGDTSLITMFRLVCYLYGIYNIETTIEEYNYIWFNPTNNDIDFESKYYVFQEIWHFIINHFENYVSNSESPEKAKFKFIRTLIGKMNIKHTVIAMSFFEVMKSSEIFKQIEHLYGEYIKQNKSSLKGYFKKLFSKSLSSETIYSHLQKQIKYYEKILFTICNNRILVLLKDFNNESAKKVLFNNDKFYNLASLDTSVQEYIKNNALEEYNKIEEYYNKNIHDLYDITVENINDFNITNAEENKICHNFITCMYNVQKATVINCSKLNKDSDNTKYFRICESKLYFPKIYNDLENINSEISTDKIYTIRGGASLQCGSLQKAGNSQDKSILIIIFIMGFLTIVFLISMICYYQFLSKTTYNICSI